jgi:hypothetical protein
VFVPYCTSLSELAELVDLCERPRAVFRLYSSPIAIKQAWMMAVFILSLFQVKLTVERCERLRRDIPLRSLRNTLYERIGSLTWSVTCISPENHTAKVAFASGCAYCNFFVVVE